MKKRLWLLLLPLVPAAGCGAISTVGAVLNEVNLFTVDQDKEFGNQLYNQIQSGEAADYPLLDATKYATAYAHLDRVLKTILNTGMVDYTSEFEWKVGIIDADVLNAFACPGGKIYVYRGLINYLDNEAQLAGVMAHEMAHIARRHSTRQMTKEYGVSTLTSMLLGDNPNQYVQIAAQLAGNVGGLSFSRTDEYEADNYAVAYLSGTEYNPLGVAGFFEKMLADGTAGGTSLTFLSTHPSPPDRIQKIKEHWAEYGSVKGNDFADRYSQVKASVR